MEFLVACGWHPFGSHRRHYFPVLVFYQSQWLGNGRSDTLSLWYAESYIASTVYHALSAWSKWKERLRKWDHAAIYWHIAGSYSPITLIAMRDQGYWGWSLFCFIWACAIAGTVMSFCRLKDHSNLETICFVGMGLSVLVAFKPLIDSVSPATVIWIVAEGVCYITGAVFYSINKRKYMHSVFHFFVLAGSICHIIAVWDILMKYI